MSCGISARFIQLKLSTLFICFLLILVSFSELNCESHELNLGDEVEFSTTKKNGKINAERIIKIPNGSIQQEVGAFSMVIVC